MRSFRIRRPSPALAVSLAALLVALGGTTYAALKLPKNSVGAKQLKAGAVTSPKVKDGSLLAKDFEAGQLPSGPSGGGGAGVQGPKGDRGDTGPVGPSQGFAAATASGSFVDSNPDGIVSQTTFSLTSAGRLYVQARGSVSVTCNPSESVVLAGLYVDGSSATQYTAIAGGSGEELATGNGGPPATFATFGVTPVLSAGDHTISYRIDCPIGSPTNVSADGSDGAIGAILVGPQQ